MKPILEKISHDPSWSFGSFEFGGRRFHCPFHYHPEIELTLIVSGTGQRYVGDHVGRFRADDLVLMGPNLPHMYISDEKIAQPAHSIVIQFLPECLGPGFFQRGELAGIRHLLERSRLGLSFHGKVRDQAALLMKEMMKSRGCRRITAFLEILELLARSRDHRTLASSTYSPSLGLYRGERINRVCGLVSRKFREGITQSEAARVAGMSAPSFSRFFRRAANKTFRTFLNEVRIGHASQLLMESDRTVAEICYDSGFGNLSNFNRQFLKMRKVTPRKFRKKFL